MYLLMEHSGDFFKRCVAVLPRQGAVVGDGQTDKSVTLAILSGVCLEKSRQDINLFWFCRSAKFLFPLLAHKLYIFTKVWHFR